jgi:hypothetical protein
VRRFFIYVEVKMPKQNALYIDSTERIACATIRVGKRLYHGARHGFAIQIAVVKGERIPIAPRHKDQGFTTTRGRYVGREEAARIAYDAGQVTKLHPKLHSEDIWGPPPTASV